MQYPCICIRNKPAVLGLYGRSPSKRWILPLAALLLILSSGTSFAQNASPKSPLPKVQQIPSLVFFEPTADPAKGGPLYMGHGNGYSVLLSKNEVALSVPSSIDPKSKLAGDYRTVAIGFAGSSNATTVEGIDPLPGKSNYFFGSNPDDWRREETFHISKRCVMKTPVPKSL